MAETIVINNSQPNGGNANQTAGSTALGWVGNLARLLLVLVIIGLIVGLVIFIDNYDAIATFFTTGFLGWLNPFDSDEGDVDPVDPIVDKYVETPLSLAWWWPGNWW